MMESHTVLFVAVTGVGKPDLGLDVLEREYLDHFDFIIILCPSHNTMRCTANGSGFGLIFMSF